jgi:DNA-binding PadR family transcriptional regulator
MLKECGCHTQRTSKFLMPAILILLAKGQSYGYHLRDDMKKQELQDGVPDQAAIYRLLRQMELNGTVKSQWATKSSGPARRSYQITPKGRKLLSAWAQSIEERRERLGRLLAAYREVTSSPSRKAAVREK